MNRLALLKCWNSALWYALSFIESDNFFLQPCLEEWLYYEYNLLEIEKSMFFAAPGGD